jgi:multisite-specific tRNA:(cytosine-C5)-methyltransferase
LDIEMGGGKQNNKRHAPGTNHSEDKKRRREKEENWKNTRGDANPRNSWSSQIVENKRFENFYKAQGFLTEDEWPAYMDSLRSSLPACFRINPDYAFVDQLKEQLLSFVGKKIVLGGVEIEGVKQMEWLKCAYKLGTDRKAIRKLPGLEGLHKWMMRHTDCGNITRQEAVSMVPPLALNVSPHHKCLDMCAAPGSKTSQLLEIVTRSLSGPQDNQG